MKKFLSIVAVLAILFAMAVPSFAAAPSVSAGDTVTGSVVGGEPGIEVEISEAEMTPEESGSLSAAAEAAAPGSTVGEVIDVELVDDEGNIVSEDYFKDGKTLTVAFTYDDAKAVTAVLYWNAATKSWDKADFEIVDGKIQATFAHLCTVAFVLGGDVQKAPEGEDPNKPDDGGKKPTDKPADKDPGKSPQTGYNTALWVAAAVVLILGAGYCFVSARKKAAE